MRLKELSLGMKGVRVVGERWATILKAACILLLLFAMALLYSRWVPNNRGGIPSTSSFVDMSRAAIVDGIGFTRPNPSFIQGAREMLEGAGLRVDVYEGGNVTIDLLRRIGGYGLLILRLHSAIDAKYGFLYLFSAERFNVTEYETRFNEERRTGAVREGITFENETYFTLRADLLGYMNQGGLNGSIIILMGCNGTNSEHAINRLFERGVKAIVAWDGYVSLEYTDEVTLTLLKLVYTEGLSYGEAIKKIMDAMGPDPIWKSRLTYLANPEG